MVFMDDSTYTGEFVHGQRHGQGVWTNKGTGESYNGQWVDGMKHGEGTFIYSNGD